MKTARGILALALLLVVIGVSGCVFVPVGPGYRRAYVAPPPVVVAPAPVVVVPRPYPYWW